MADFEFCVETRREVTVAIADRLRYDKPATPTENGEEDHRKIVRMSLRFREPHGHEHDITEWDERDLFGKGAGIPTIVRGVELASCRDAAYRFGGDCIYVLAFHAKDYNNRSSFVFKLPGGQEVQHMAMTTGRGGGMHGSGGREDIGIAERLMPDILKYVSEKEERIEKKAELVFNTIMKQNQQYAEVVTGYTDRELKLREIALNAGDHQYERDQKHKEDEENARTKREGIEFFKEKVVPEVLPYVVQAIQRFSNGPGGTADGPDFQRWYEEREAAKKASEGGSPSAERSQSQNSHRNGHGGNGGGVAQEGTNGGGLEPSMFEKLQLRVALDTTSFIGLLKTRNKFEVVREALTDPQRELFDEIAKVSGTFDIDQKEEVEKISGLALMFGAAVQSDPSTGFKLLGVLDGMCKISLVELSNLLKIYHEATQSQNA
jgi:hypothetical protein